MRLEQSKRGPCLFRLMRGDRVVLITVVHVDDMIVAAETEYLCDWFYAELRRSFVDRSGRSFVVPGVCV